MRVGIAKKIGGVSIGKFEAGADLAAAARTAMHDERKEQHQPQTPSAFAAEVEFNIAELAKEVSERYYLRPFNPQEDKKNLYEGPIARVSHGATHACRVAILVRILVNLYRELGDPEALLLTEVDIQLLQVVALYHDAMRQSDYKDSWEFESRQVLERKLVECGVEQERARAFAKIVTQKEQAGILGRIFQSADALDIMRIEKELLLEKVSLYNDFKDNPDKKRQIENLAFEVRALLAKQHDLKYPCRIICEGEELFQEQTVEATRKPNQPELKEAYELSPALYKKLQQDLADENIPELNRLFNGDKELNIDYAPPKVTSLEDMNVAFEKIFTAEVQTPISTMKVIADFLEKHKTTIIDVLPAPEQLTTGNLYFIPAIQQAAIDAYARFAHTVQTVHLDVLYDGALWHLLSFKDQAVGREGLQFIQKCIGDQFSDRMDYASILDDKKNNLFRFRVSRKRYNALRQWHWGVHYPNSDFALIKSLRGDDMCFVEEAFAGITGEPEKQRPFRPYPKGTHTVTSRGVERRDNKLSQYTDKEKAGFSQIQPTSMMTADAFSPAFGIDRGEDKLVGVMLPETDALLNRLFKYDGGTVTRPCDFTNEQSAKKYYRNKVLSNKQVLYTTLSSFMEAIEKYQKSINETMARLYWSKQGKLVVFSNNLNSRLLAQGYAALLKQQIRQRYEAGDANYSWFTEDYEVPIVFYDNTSLKTLVAYAAEQQGQDRVEAVAKIEKAELDSDIEHCHYEFLLALEHPKDQSGLNELLVKQVPIVFGAADSDEKTIPLWFKLYEDGYEHILMILEAKGFQLPAFEEQNWENYLAYCPSLLFHVARRNQDKARLLHGKYYQSFLEESRKPNNNRLVLKAFQHLRFDVVDFFLGLDDFVVDVNHRGIAGMTLLHLAANNGRTEAVKLLLVKGAAVNDRGKGYWTALHRAAENGHTDTIQLLLEKGAAVNARGESNLTALHLAAQNGRTEAVKLLLQKGAAVNALDECYWTALHYAAKNGHSEAVKLLLQKGAAVDADDRNQKTALHVAAQNGHTDVVELLLDQGANIYHIYRHPQFSYDDDGEYLDAINLLDRFNKGNFKLRGLLLRAHWIENAKGRVGGGSHGIYGLSSTEKEILNTPVKSGETLFSFTLRYKKVSIHDFIDAFVVINNANLDKIALGMTGLKNEESILDVLRLLKKKEAIQCTNFEGFGSLYRFAKLVGYTEVIDKLNELVADETSKPSWYLPEDVPIIKPTPNLVACIQHYNATWLQNEGDDYRRAVKLFQLYCGQNNFSDRADSTAQIARFFTGKLNRPHTRAVNQVLKQYRYKRENTNKVNLEAMLKKLEHEITFEKEKMKYHADLHAILKVIKFHVSDIDVPYVENASALVESLSSRVATMNVVVTQRSLRG